MQLITPEEILSLAFSPDDRIDPAHIRAARIEAAQLRYIRPAFGSAMYRKMILEQYGSFVSGYIKPALAHFVRYELIGELAVRASDRGLVRPSSSESTQTTSATRNDQQDRKETLQQESIRNRTDDKTTSESSESQTTDQSTTKQTTTNESLRSGSDQRTTTLIDTDKTTVQSNSSQQADTSIATTVSEKKETRQTNGTKETTDELTQSVETSEQGSRTDTVSGTRKVLGEESGSVKTETEQEDLTTKNATLTSKTTSENNGTGTTSEFSLSAATAEEWQLLSRQALRDARTFLRYAVEHVETNRAQFPEYDPASGLGSSSTRRCIGGIIL